MRTLFPDAHKYTSLVFPLEKIGDAENGFEIKSLNIKRIVPEGVKNAVPANLILDVAASSEHGKGADGDASALWDGDEGTYWHSKYDTKGGNDAPPFEITVTFKHLLALDGLKFLPRRSGDNGNIKHAELFAKNDDGKWTKIATYRNDSPNREMKSLEFPKTATTALKLVILDGIGKFGTMAEIYPILSVKHGGIPVQK
ncbi:MAG: discoidin domain-containing protein [Opitutales bacterium]|nr:discoidin domain-containing protein [Opitutales bacterium]